MKLGTVRINLALFGLCAALHFATPESACAQDAPTTNSAQKTSHFEIDRDEIRRSLFEYFGWGATYPEIRVEPKMEILEKAEEIDHFRWRVRYEVDPGEYSFAYLLIPKPFPAAGTRLPLVLCPHPTALTGKDRVVARYPDPPKDEKDAYGRAARQYALDAVREGFIAFAPDRAAYGERRRTQDTDVRKQMAAYQEYLQTLRPGWRLTAGKNVWDLQRALDFLTTLEFVDAERIGTMGHSLGAWDSLMLLAADDRVKTAVVNSGGSLRFEPELWQNETALREYLGNPKKQSLNVNSNLMFMLAAGRSMLYIWSTEDAYDRGGPNLVDGYRVIKNAYKTNFRKEGKTDLSHFIHSRGHDFPPPARAAAFAWLKEKLSTPAASDVAVPLEGTIGAPLNKTTEEPELSENEPVAAPVESLRAPDGVAKENFHLYLLVGQSNMAGRGEVGEIDRQPHQRVFSLGKENQWVPATEPLHSDIKNRGIGPGLAFGKAMAQANPDATIGLIPSAVGGTLVSYWLPGAERALFETAVRQAKRAQTTGTIKGILWQQGESDSYGDRPDFYRERLLAVLRGFRRELGDENIPIVIGGLGDFLKSPKAGDVNEALQAVAGEIGNAVFVPASKKGHIGDRLHFNAEAARENGEMMAHAMRSLVAKQ